MAGPRYSWCSQSRVASASRAGSIVMACTSNAARAALAAASACGTEVGNKAGVGRRQHLVSDEHPARDLRVDRELGRPGSRRRPRRREREAAVDGRRHVVGVTLDRASACRSSHSRSGPTPARLRAANRPATMAAEEEPSPRPWGTVLCAWSRSPGARTPGRSRPVMAVARIRWEWSRGISAAPSPVTSTRNPSSITSMVTRSTSPGQAEASKPGPTFALVAGAATVVFRPTPSGDRSSARSDRRIVNRRSRRPRRPGPTPTGTISAWVGVRADRAVSTSLSP